jgi:regulator of CtrA degradation
MAIFFEGTYDETLDLLVEARDYLTELEPIGRRGLGTEERLVLNCEAFRITSRLTQVMAWLLIQKAVHAGELTRRDAAAEEHRLAGHSVCLANDLPPVSLPASFVSLLDRSYRLYTRVERLDALVGLEGLAEAS